MEKIILIELFAILLMLYGGFLQTGYRDWILIIALFIGFLTLIQGLAATR